MNTLIEKITLYEKWDANETHDWLDKSARGKWFFVWNIGVFRWGGFMLPGLMFISYGTRFESYPTGWTFFIESLSLNLLMAITAGLIYGNLLWHGTKANYEKHTGKRMSQE